MVSIYCLWILFTQKPKSDELTIDIFNFFTLIRANPHRFSFDDITSAMLALFEVLSFKGWVDIREALLKRFDNSVSICSSSSNVVAQYIDLRISYEKLTHVII